MGQSAGENEPIERAKTNEYIGGRGVSVVVSVDHVRVRHWRE